MRAHGTVPWDVFWIDSSKLQAAEAVYPFFYPVVRCCQRKPDITLARRAIAVSGCHNHVALFK
jgi:hypothetical protein